MTTWMTPVGVALIVGGVTTLIVFRAALFPSAARDRRAGGRGQARRRAGADPRARGAGRRTSAGASVSVGATSRGGRRGRAVRPVEASAGRPADQSGDLELDIDQDLDRAADVADEDERSRAPGVLGLHLLALDQPWPDEGPRYAADLSGPFDAVAGADRTGSLLGLFDDVALQDGALHDPDETAFVPATGVAAGWPERADLRHGDRVEGWIRPEYQEEPVAGEYWNPAPASFSETGYGWPTPVERLPVIPPYPPSSGFDVPAELEAEPARPVPQWPPARPDDRIGLPRSWSYSGGTGPRFRTAVRREQPAADISRTAAELVAGPARVPAPPGRFGGDPSGAPATGYPRFAEPRTLPADRFTGGAGTNRVPARRGPRAGDSGPYPAREEGLRPVWAVPDLPEAAMPDLAFSPGEINDEGAARWVRRPAVMTRRRRGAGPMPGVEATQALPPTDLAHLDHARARPRPHPRPGAGQPEPRSIVYVSRHAADPS